MSVAVHELELDEDALAVAQVELGTGTPGDTVNEALRAVADARRARIRAALDGLAKIEWADREEMWG